MEVSPNAVGGRWDEPAIVAAAARSDDRAVRILLFRGADPNAAGRTGVTALAIAVERYPALATYLLAHGAHPDAADPDPSLVSSAIQERHVGLAMALIAGARNSISDRPRQRTCRRSAQPLQRAMFPWRAICWPTARLPIRRATIRSLTPPRLAQRSCCWTQGAIPTSRTMLATCRWRLLLARPR